MIKWLAGLLEGEGHFRIGKSYTDRSPRITIGMTDRDVVEKVAKVFNTATLGPYSNQRRTRKARKPIFVAQVGGVKGLAIMLDVFSYLGERRRQRIVSVLDTWEHAPRPAWRGWTRS